MILKQASPKVFIVVPAYNEASVIRNTVQELSKTEYEIVIVDDGSQDYTQEAISGLSVHKLRHSINMGQGAALQTGMQYALQQGADIVIHFDADGQHRVEDLPSLIFPLLIGKADLVLGSRFLAKEASQSVPIFRKILLKMGTLINGLFTGYWLSDAHNGLRALNRKALCKIQLKENGMAHATEILLEARKHRLRTQEVAVTLRYTAYSQQKGQSSWNAINIFNDIVLRKIFP